MNNNTLAYCLAFTANVLFAFSIQIFTHYSRKISPIWMNFIKASIALVFFFFTVMYMNGSFYFDSTTLSLVVISGILGLGLGDLALLVAFRDLGPGRAMVIVAFHPIITGFLAYFLFNQTLSWGQMSAILFMICCLFALSYESIKKSGNWGVKGIILVLIAVLMDSIGVMMLKKAEKISGIDGYQVGFYRCLGVFIFFLIWNYFKPFKIVESIKEQSNKSIAILIFGAILGTFLPLIIMFKAYTIADNLATISAINISCSLFATLFECIHTKKMPNRYQIASFFLMICGVSIFFICG